MNAKHKIEKNHNRNIIQDITPTYTLCNCVKKKSYELTLPNKEYNIQRKHKLWYSKLRQRKLCWYVRNNIKEKIRKPQKITEPQTYKNETEL